jgi:outer membrane protein TolC
VAAADAEARAAMRRAEAVALDARRQIRSAYAGLRAARELVVTYRDSVIPARAAITSGEQGEYFFMLKGPFDPLRAKAEELKAREALAAALSQYWVQRVELARAAGDLALAREPAVPAQGANP